MRDAIAEFISFNRALAKRNPELLRLKVARMAAGPFPYFRGTFHLFAHDVLSKNWSWWPLMSGAGMEMDLVGDIHSENYGTFKAADGKIHYDINDFDETTHGRFDFDMCRLTTSLLLAAQDRGDRLGDAVQVPLAALVKYADMLPRLLKKGANYDVVEKGGSGCACVDELVRAAADARRSDFITRLTTTENGKRKLTRSLNYFNLPAEEAAQALRLLEDYQKRMAPPAYPDFYKVDDVCGRVAGVGSMGRFRYAVLVNGKGKKEARNVLLEFKEARPSALDLYRDRETDAGAFARRAEQVVAVERASQAASSPHLGFAIDGAMSFQVREISPHDTRLDFKSVKKTDGLAQVAEVHATILARAHARSAARCVGVANPLAELSDREAFCQNVLAFALAYADLVRRDWMQFVSRRAEMEKCETWA
jgi:uncharacterized protein (DUF2252 family)